MDFNDFFAKQAELTMNVLADVPDVPGSSIDHRLLCIGGACLAVAAALHVWASWVLVDPGYFARTSVFLGFMLLAGVAVLIGTLVASAWQAVSRARAREAMKERTAAHLISSNRVIALRLAATDIRAA